MALNGGAVNIDKDELILAAIKKVYASLFNKNSKLYSKIYGINLKKESMAVLIQEVAPVVKAGVMFSCNPINLEKKYIIESTKGLGTTVVEGVGNICHLEINYVDKDKQDIKNRRLDITDIVQQLNSHERIIGNPEDIIMGLSGVDERYKLKAIELLKLGGA